MKQIGTIYKEKKTVYSFEVFPPKRDSSVETVYRTLEELNGLWPDFISVTYGAGGSHAGHTTAEIAETIQKSFGIPALAHLTCRNATAAEIAETVEALKAVGVNNILALRGDPRPDLPPSADFLYARDLILMLQKTAPALYLAAACYPEAHTESESPEADLIHLREKVDAGVGSLTSQLFFDNALFFDFLSRARAAGITVPVSAGIMPVTNKTQIEKMVSMCGASIPQKLAHILGKYESDPETLRTAGIDYAADQIIDLIERGVDGIHLYTMNNADVARQITQRIAPALRKANGGAA